MIGIALTGVAVGLAWLAVAVTLGVTLGRAIRRADEAEKPSVDAELVALLGVIDPREPTPAS